MKMTFFLSFLSLCEQKQETPINLNSIRDDADDDDGNASTDILILSAGSLRLIVHMVEWHRADFDFDRIHKSSICTVKFSQNTKCETRLVKYKQKILFVWL